jgi:hypothetical protein
MSGKKIVLKKLKELDTIWHPESTLVFKSSKDKIVIGRYEDDKFVSLDDTSLELCDTWKFKYDESLLEKNEEVEEIEETEEAEEETEEVDETDEVSDVKENIDENTEVVEDNENVVKIMELYNDNDTNKLGNEKLIPILQETIPISDITKEYSDKIHKYFDSLSQSYNLEILNMKNEIINITKINEKLENELKVERENHSNTISKLEKLQTKFDGIKQLFSL